MKILTATFLILSGISGFWITTYQDDVPTGAELRALAQTVDQTVAFDETTATQETRVAQQQMQAAMELTQNQQAQELQNQIQVLNQRLGQLRQRQQQIKEQPDLFDEPKRVDQLNHQLATMNELQATLENLRAQRDELSRAKAIQELARSRNAAAEEAAAFELARVNREASDLQTVERRIRNMMGDLQDKDGDRDEVEAQLREALRNVYEQRLEVHQKQMQRLRKRLNQMEEQLQRRREAMDEMIDLRLRLLMRQSELGLDFDGAAVDRFWAPRPTRPTIPDLPEPRVVPPRPLETTSPESPATRPQPPALPEIVVPDAPDVTDLPVELPGLAGFGSEAEAVDSVTEGEHTGFSDRPSNRNSPRRVVFVSDTVFDGGTLSIRSLTNKNFNMSVDFDDAREIIEAQLTPGKYVYIYMQDNEVMAQGKFEKKRGRPKTLKVRLGRVDQPAEGNSDDPEIDDPNFGDLADFETIDRVR